MHYTIFSSIYNKYLKSGDLSPNDRSCSSKYFSRTSVSDNLPLRLFAYTDDNSTIHATSKPEIPNANDSPNSVRYVGLSGQDTCNSE